MSEIFLTGDTHNSRELMKKFNSKNFKIKKELTKDDVVIILGDVGSLTWDRSKETLYNLKWLDNQPFTTLFIDGNHDNFNILDNLPVKQLYGNEVGVLSDSVYHLKRGNIYEINGKTFLTIGGATSINKEWRIPEISWWDREVINNKEIENTYRNLEKYNYKVDYILTHTIFDKVADLLIKGKVEKCPTANFLKDIYNKVEFDKWVFGHFHIDSRRDFIMLAEYASMFTCLYDEVVNIKNL